MCESQDQIKSSFYLPIHGYFWLEHFQLFHVSTKSNVSSEISEMFLELYDCLCGPDKVKCWAGFGPWALCCKAFYMLLPTACCSSRNKNKEKKKRKGIHCFSALNCHEIWSDFHLSHATYWWHSSAFILPHENEVPRVSSNGEVTPPGGLSEMSCKKKKVLFLKVQQLDLFDELNQMCSCCLTRRELWRGLVPMLVWIYVVWRDRALLDWDVLPRVWSWEAGTSPGSSNNNEPPDTPKNTTCWLSSVCLSVFCFFLSSSLLPWF